jgi:4-amino-4-deoxy-L-arabinose transferase-like glycosyltransferase
MKWSNPFLKENGKIIEISIISVLVLLTFLLRVCNTSDFSGGDDSAWAEFATYAIQDPKLIIYPHMPDAPIQWQGMYVSRPSTIISFMIPILIFGHTRFAMAFTPAFFSAASIIFLYLLVRRFFKRKIAYLACFLFAVSPFHLAFSRTSFLHASLIFSATAALWFLIVGLEKKKTYLIYLSAFFWLINITTTDIRGAVPIIAVIPCLYFLIMRGSFDLRKLFANKLFRHFLASYVGVLAIFAMYIAIPLIWGDSGFINRFVYFIFYSVGNDGVTPFMGLWESITRIGSIIIFTPFLGLIFIPFLAGLIISIINFRKFNYSFWLFYLVGIIFFYIQGDFVPERQTIFVPAIATLAAIGIMHPYNYFRQNLKKYLLPSVLGLTFAYPFFMLFMFAKTYPKDFLAIKSTAATFGLGGVLDAFAKYWWFFAILVLLAFALIFLLSEMESIYPLIKRAYILIIVAFLILNFALSILLVATGVGVYKRSTATSVVGEYLKEHLGDEKYSCVAGMQADSFTYYTERMCAIWLFVNVSWLDEQVSQGNVKYFIVEPWYEYGTTGLGNVLPDGSMGPEITNTTDWSSNHYDKYKWLQEHGRDITSEVGLEDGRYFRVYTLKK